MKLLRITAAVIAALVIATVSLLAAPPAQACACGGFVVSDGEQVAADAEYAVISQDGDQEHVLLSMNTATITRDAALLIPTPAPADAALAEPNVFSELRAATAPQVTVRYRWWPETNDGAGAAPTGAAGGGDVTVLKTSRLGPLEVSVLAANDAAKLSTWLSSHGYVMREDMAEALKPYVSDGWYYTAIRLTADGANLSGALQPLHLTFDSDSLVYPMRLSAAADRSQFVRTYVFADHQVTRTDRTAETAGTSVYFAGTVPPAALTANSLVAIRSTHPYLTVIDQFFHTPSKQIVSDFTFAQDDQDRPYRQIIETTRVHTILGVPAGPVLTVGGVVLVLGAAVLIISRLRRRRNPTGLS